MKIIFIDQGVATIITTLINTMAMNHPVETTMKTVIVVINQRISKSRGSTIKIINTLS
jgi:hypothetical protein